MSAGGFRPGLVRDAAWPDGAGAALATPLQPSTVYRAAGPAALDALYERGEGFTYSREGHPNAAVLAAKIDRLEGLAGGTVTSSGMSALSAVFLALLDAGQHVVAADQLYGRTLRLMRRELPRLGVEVSLADPTDTAAVGAALRPDTRLIVIETVSNPTLRIPDLPAIAALAREAGALLVVDNTFPTPLGIRPLEHGADVVVHSVTKLLSGHSDVLAGYAGARNGDVGRAIGEAAITWGLTASPWECWMAERGLFTFSLRNAHACASAARLADALAGAPGVSRVIYPGRADHPDRARAARLLDGGGNMVSFELAGGRPAAEAFVSAAPGLAFAPTLGDVATTLSHPASSSHREITEAARRAIGISEGFFRVSVGLEPAEALVAEVTAALESAARG